MMGWYDDGDWVGWILMTAAMVAFWAIVVFAVIAIFRGTQRPPEQDPDRLDPMDILDERFAHGEIDEDEYHARRSVLAASHQARTASRWFPPHSD